MTPCQHDKSKRFTLGAQWVWCSICGAVRRKSESTGEFLSNWQTPEPEQLVIDEVFPFEYVGGGYFRRKGAPKGEAAETLHGIDAPQYIVDQINLHHGI